jgi:hypothetical protein
LSRARSRALLVGAIALGCALLWLVWFRVRRTSHTGQVVDSAPSPEGLPQAASDPPALEAGPQRVPLQAAGPARVQELQTARAGPAATLTGFLTIDESPPAEGTVFLRAEELGWEQSVAIQEGGFRVDAVPGARLELSFEIPPQDERRVLLPSLEVFPEPGAVKDLSLHWKTQHVNLRVLREDGQELPATVTFTGPGYAASLETDERGKALLGLVGGGLFSFRALARSGGSGEATLELEEGVDLETVLITVAD